MKTVLTSIKRIGNKLIRDTPFRYRLEQAPVRTAWENATTEGMQFVDFGRTFGTHAPAAAFAYTQMTAAKASRITIEIAHTDACTVWLNGKQVYTKSGKRTATIKLDERSIEMPFSFKTMLRKGTNELLIRSITSGNKPWLVYIQPPSNHGAVINTESTPITIGLQRAQDIDAKIAAITNWLVLGPLPAKTQIIPTLAFGTMYADTTWTIPKIDVLGNLLDPLPWGTNYHWNYHNAGVAWAMQCLAEVSKQQKYKTYADRFCDFHINGTPFVRHQVKKLNAVLCANHFIIDTPLLDFTLATALPYIYRLRKETSFEKRQAYMDYVSGILSYAQNGQVRLPGNPIYTRITPEKFTTWVDDMFMGIPFLVQASQYVPENQKKRFMDDAAQQCLGFIKEVWDEKAQLYVHARIHGKPLRSAHWARCNGWATWAMSEVLQVLPKTHPLFAPIMEQYLRHLDCLIKWQDKDGFWTNVIDRPDSPQEVSGTAIFVMSLARAVRNGWSTDNTYRTAAIKGWGAISSKIDKDGNVYNICVGTMCSDDINYYCSRPFYDNDTHGLFAVLFAGIEMHLLTV